MEYESADEQEDYDEGSIDEVDDTEQGIDDGYEEYADALATVPVYAAEKRPAPSDGHARIMRAIRPRLTAESPA